MNRYLDMGAVSGGVDLNLLSERYRNILGAIIREYIDTAEPVSSKVLVARYSLGLSPATVRNIMAELENGGFLVQPHTSAGRVPTEKSFRFYVDSLLVPQEPLEGDKDLLNRCCGGVSDLEDALTGTTRALSLLTSCAGLAFVPTSESFIIRHVKLLPVDNSALVVLMVSKLGIVKTRHIRLDSDITRLDLESVSNYLSSIGYGLTIRGLRARIVEEMGKEKNLYDELLSGALKLGAMALANDGGPSGDGVFVEGKVNVLQQPEFRDDFERMKKIFSAFEEKSLLVKILDKSLDDDRTHVSMGSESSIKEFEGLSFVTSPYSMHGSVMGSLGVIGPVRMDYSKIVPLVEYTAGLLSKVL